MDSTSPGGYSTWSSLRRGWKWIGATAVLSLAALVLSGWNLVPRYDSFVTLAQLRPANSFLDSHDMVPSRAQINQAVAAEIGSSRGDGDSVARTSQGTADSRRLHVIVRARTAELASEQARSIAQRALETIGASVVSDVSASREFWRDEHSRQSKAWNLLTESLSDEELRSPLVQAKLELAATSLAILEQQLAGAAHFLENPTSGWVIDSTAESPPHRVEARWRLALLSTFLPPLLVAFLWLLWDASVSRQPSSAT